jgi:hypothetical protein
VLRQSRNNVAISQNFQLTLLDNVAMFNGVFFSRLKMLSPPDFDLFPKLKKPIRGKRFRSIEEVSNEVT